VPGSAADTKTNGAAVRQSSGMLSLIEVAPELYFTAKRHSKFYGDPNTTHGNILERSYLLGNPGGVRDTLVDHGFYFDFGVTQFLQRNVSGGDDKNTRYNGSADAWLWFDTGKAGLWPGGAAFLHGEGRWRSGINTDTGSLLPSNFDQTMPDADPNDSNWALSEWYFLQGLPANFLAAAGKIDDAAWADTNMFANSERDQFLYTGLINNAIAGVFFPYTTLTGWLTWSPSKAHTLTGVYSMSEGKATAEKGAFDTLTTKDNSYAFQYIFATEIAKRPGRYLVAALYSTKEIPSFDVSDRQLIGEALGFVPVDEKSDNYAVVANFAQYLWVKEGSTEAFNKRREGSPHRALTHHNLPPVGIGIFGRAGWAPDDRNAIDQFYSFGIGGYGMLIPGRDGDRWGIGWAGSHISSDLREFPVGLDNWEHAYEAFYNFMLTPAAHLSVNAQAIEPANEFLDTAYTLGTRLQLDF
jgi:carbohydrate-selective porin OprB